MDINECFAVSHFEVDESLRKLIDKPVNEDLIDKNKYANNSEFVPDSIYKRVLNQATNYRWSFVPHEITTVDGKYVQYIGLLIVPGYGVHTGIGTQKLTKSDNSNAVSAAKTYAFKNACKEMGIAPNVGNDAFDEELFEDLEDEPVEEAPKKKKPAPAKAKAEKKPAPKKSVKDAVEEIRSAYELDDDDDFVAFIQIWDENIIDLKDMDDKKWKAFLKDVEENPGEYEDF